MSTGKKEYSLKINGITQSITDATKLEAVLKKLDITANKVTSTENVATKSVKEKTKALTDEEKAALKLATTQKRIEDANSDANRAQIEANIALRERTREITRSIQITNLAEGSIKQMGMTLTDLRNKYEDLSEAQRQDMTVGGELLDQIQALDTKYKRLRESTGNFRDSVGNYEKASAGLKGLSEGLNEASRGSAGLASNFFAGNAILDAFGDTTDKAAKGTEQLSGIVETAGKVQAVYTAVIKEKVIQEKASAVLDTVRTIQIRAKAAAEAQATKGTILATIAQAAFNVVASANPYVLLALAIVGVGAAMYALSQSTENAAEEQKKLNELEAVWLDRLDEEARKTKANSDIRVSNMERYLKVAQAQDGKLKETRKLEDDIARERELNNARLSGFYYEELQNLDVNREKLNQYKLALLQLQKAQANGDSSLRIDIDLDGKTEKVDVEEAIASVQGAVDTFGRKVTVALDLQTEKADLAAAAALRAVERAKEDKEILKKAKDLAKEKRSLEMNAERAAADARLKLIENTYDQAREQTKESYRRQIEDLQTQLAEETKLTVKARNSINATIRSLQKLQNKELQALAKEQARKELETQRQLEDSYAALALGQMDRRRNEIELQYERQTQDLKKRLEDDKSLTEKQREAINQIIINAERARQDEITAMVADDLNKRTDLELSALDFRLAQVKNKVGEMVARDKDGLKLIDVAKTKQNFEETNAALGKYVEDIKAYQDDLTVAHEMTLTTLQEGTPEYEAEVQKYAQAMEDATQRIKAAQKEQVENTKTSSRTQVDYLKDLFGKIGEYASLTADTVGGIFDTWNMGIQAQLDDLNTQLDVINERYEEAQKQRENAVKNVQDIEAQLQQATGGTSEALQQQLADAMAARNEAAREEQRLAKEKEKREAEIAKKEKQMRRNDLIAKIAQGFANTALGITQALSLVFPLNLIVAGIVGSMGLVQTAIMGKQLAKLERGGEIKGKRHSEGGVPIGLGYEAEDGEFMTNRRSYAANKALVNFINDTPRTITAADLVGVLPPETTPNVILNSGDNGSSRIVEAINEIDMQPTVAVKDIMDVTDEVTTVRDLSGY